MVGLFLMFSLYGVHTRVQKHFQNIVWYEYDSMFSK